MGCAVEESVNEALRSCGACVAMGAQRNIVPVQRMDATIASPGVQTTLTLNVPDKDAQGRVAHVRAIILTGQVNITSAAVSDAISAYNLRRLYQQLVLEDVTGHQFFAGIDARSLEDDTWCRHYSHVKGFFGREHFGVQGRMPVITGNLGVPANANTTANYDMTVVYPLSTWEPSSNPLEGLVPLSALQLALAGGIRLRWGATGDLAGTPVGQTVNGYVRWDGAAGFDLWLDLLYLPAVVADEAWTLTHAQYQQQNMVLPRGDERSELLALRYLPEDAAALAGQELCSQFTGMTLQVGGNAIIPGRTELDVRTRSLLFAGTARQGAHVHDNAAMDLPMLNASSDPLIQLLLPYAPRELSAAGSVNIEAVTRTPNFWRFLHRTVRCYNDKGQVARRAATIYRAAQCGPCGGIFGSDPRGMKAAPSGNRPLIMQPSKFMARRA